MAARQAGSEGSLRQIAHVQRVFMEGEISESVALYPDLERIDPDRSFDQIHAAPQLRPFVCGPTLGPQIPSMIAEGKLRAKRSNGLRLRHRLRAERGPGEARLARVERKAHYQHE